jgi:hypothetical protein
MAINLNTLAKIRGGSEAQEQVAFVDWLEIMQIPYYHVPNGGFRTEKEGAKLKRMGVKAGVPDICIVRACGEYHGAYVELKRKGGFVSKVQRKWLQLLGKEGYYAIVAYGAVEAIAGVKEYLKAG